MLEPTNAERDIDFWRSFNPLYWVGVNVYKLGDGGIDHNLEDAVWFDQVVKEDEVAEEEEEVNVADGAPRTDTMSTCRAKTGLPPTTHREQHQEEITDKLNLTLEMLLSMNGELSEMSTHLDQ
ncbi:uncharacterized protein LOC127812860 [Diospyros lotus]|uniref:uncharacterized protein LOC127812860 n=1 Tax=Diospyros lotus TaxID=55363 RepID=UPI00224F17DE|nr:uncharacterized protein LOC127812860 [Diospyros lotus]